MRSGTVATRPASNGRHLSNGHALGFLQSNAWSKMKNRSYGIPNVEKFQLPRWNFPTPKKCTTSRAKTSRANRTSGFNSGSSACFWYAHAVVCWRDRYCAHARHFVVRIVWCVCVPPKSRTRWTKPSLQTGVGASFGNTYWGGGVRPLEGVITLTLTGTESASQGVMSRHFDAGECNQSTERIRVSRILYLL